MTRSRIAPFALVASIFLACDPEPAPVEANLIPLRMVALDGTRELEYDANGRLTGIWMISQLSNGGEMRSLQSLFYNDAGQLTNLTTDTGWKIEYTWENGRIVAADEIVMGQWSQVHRYTYNNLGQIVESKTFQYIEEEGGLIPVASGKHTYDNNGNLTALTLFYFTSFGAEEKLLTSITFGDYDNRHNSEDLFSFSPFNPLVKLRNNNPGTMTVANAKGIISSINRYTYTYNDEGYATAKTTVVSIANQADQLYETTYTFKK